MTCSTLLNLIVLGGFGVAIATGVMTESLLAKAGYEPKNYLAGWRERVSSSSTPVTG